MRRKRGKIKENFITYEEKFEKNRTTKKKKKHKNPTKVNYFLLYSNKKDKPWTNLSHIPIV